MNILPILVFAVGLLTCVYSNAISDGGNSGFCPPPENIAPCICFKVNITERVTAQCSNFTDAKDIQKIFDRNPGWNLKDVWIVNSVISYLPADMLEKAYFQSLNISSTTLVTLFDRTPKSTPELYVYIKDVQILRGFSWSSIANANLKEITAINMKIKSFGQEFKENFPKGARKIWFRNTGVSSIKYQAFSGLTQLEFLQLSRGNLKKVSRDMFPNPWNVYSFDLSYHKIAALPEDFFTNMPKLFIFSFKGNMLSTLSEKVFIKHHCLYNLGGNPINCACNLKWIFGNMKIAFFRGECYEPKSLKGTKFEDLKAESFEYCK